MSQLEVSAQQQELTVTVTRDDYFEAAKLRVKGTYLEGALDTTKDPIARAVCRQFELPLGSVSVGIEVINVFDGDAAEDRLVACYRMDPAGQSFVAKYDTFKRVALPYVFTATLTEVERKKAQGEYASYDVIEEPAAEEPGLQPEPILVGADD